MDEFNQGIMRSSGWPAVAALFFGALVLSAALVPAVGRLAFKAGAVDHGGGRRVHSGSIPRMGGLAVFSSCLIVLAAFFLASPGSAVPDKRVIGLALAASLVFLVGVYDDIKNLRVYKKLLVQALAGCILYWSGFKADFLFSFFGASLDLSPLNLPLTVLWVLVITNSINLIDGLDGVAAGTGIFVALSMLSVSNDAAMQAAALVLTGSLAGFLLHNYPPARIFMGDSGSLFTGLVLAALSMAASNKSTTALGIMVPMTAFAFPLMDMTYAVLRRYYRGLPLGKADKEHIHHKLLEKGFSKKRVILLLYGVNLSLMLLVALVVSTHRISVLWYFAAAAAIAAGGLKYLNYVNFWALLKTAVRDHASGRKRKYNSYLLRAFRRDIEKIDPEKADEIYARVASLLEDMDFTSAKIHLNPAVPLGGIKYVWVNPNKKSSSEVSLSFPLEHKGRFYGKARLRRNSREVPDLCMNELMSALSSAVCCALEDKEAARSNSRPVAVAGNRTAPKMDKVLVPINLQAGKRQAGGPARRG